MKISSILFLNFSLVSSFISLKEPAAVQNEVSNKNIISKEDIIVTLTTEESQKWLNYDPSHFGIINCKEIRDLTSSYRDVSQRANNPDFKRILKLSFDEKEENDVLNSIEKIKKIQGVDNAAPNYLFKINNHDTFINNNNRTYNLNIGWGNEKINLSSAKQLISNHTKNTVNVGVVEFGINGYHEDLVGRINNELSKSFLTGGNYYQNSSPLFDEYSDGHGTAVAGIIAANYDNIGVEGVCDTANIVSLKTYIQGESTINGTIYNNTDNLIEILNYAHQKEIRILNFSFSYDIYDESIETAIRNYGDLIVCGAGNSNNDIDYILSYPAGYELDNILSVGGMNQNNSMWVSSDTFGTNYGKNRVDLFAPAENIYSTSSNGEYPAPTNLYNSYIGTSFAAPFVTGVAAMLLSIENQTHFERFSAYDLKGIIMDSVSNNNNFSNLCVAEGFLNAHQSINTALTVIPNYTYAQHDSTYHIAINQYGTPHFEEHFWIINNSNLKSSNLDYNISMIPGYSSFVCRWCGALKFS